MEILSKSCHLCRDCNNEPRVIVKENNFALLECVNCGFRWVYPAPRDTTFIYRDNSSYFDGQLKCLAQRIKKAKSILKSYAGICKKMRILDVGCGVGPFLQAAKSFGWEAEGVEESRLSSAYLISEGFKVSNDDFLKATFLENSFDLVLMWHVLEHLSDPFSALIKARKLLKKNGRILIAIPNSDNFIYRFFYKLIKFKSAPRRLIGSSGFVEHVSHFNSKNIRLFLSKAGFKILKETVDNEMLTHCYTKKEMAILCFAVLVNYLTGRIGSEAMIILASKN